MRKSLFVLGVAGLLLAGATAAQAGGSVFAGLSLPSGTFGDFANTGFHGGFSYGVPAAPTLTVGGMASYHMFGAKDYLDHDMSDESYHVFEVLGFAKLAAPSGPFGLVGLGLGNLGTSLEGVDSETKLASALGGGFSFTVIDVMALYHMISTEGETTKMITVSAAYNF